MFEHEYQVIENAAFRMEIRRLFTSESGGDLGERLDQQSALLQQFKSARGVRGTEQFDQFVPNSLGADSANFGGSSFNGREGLGFDAEIELRRQPHGPQQAQVVFGKTFRRRTDRTDHFRP